MEATTHTVQHGKGPMDKEHLIDQLKEIKSALQRFLIFDKQIPEWEADPSMITCLPDLYLRHEKALDRYLQTNGENGMALPLIPHDRITAEKIDAVAALIHLEMATSIPNALEQIGPRFDYCPKQGEST